MMIVSTTHDVFVEMLEEHLEQVVELECGDHWQWSRYEVEAGRQWRLVDRQSGSSSEDDRPDGQFADVDLLAVGQHMVATAAMLLSGTEYVRFQYQDDTVVKTVEFNAFQPQAWGFRLGLIGEIGGKMIIGVGEGPAAILIAAPSFRTEQPFEDGPVEGVITSHRWDICKILRDLQMGETTSPRMNLLLERGASKAAGHKAEV